MQSFVDLRSDTVTRPTPEMYKAMAEAPLGDDVLGDDPTVIKLEELSAEKVGKEAALFFPSGSMSNQVGLAVQTRPCDSVVMEEEAHMLFYEGGAPGIIAQVVTRTVKGDHGVMDPAEVESKILKRSYHTPGTTLICIENSHNRASGAVAPVATMAAYREVADRNGLRIHLDGARVFNAAAALVVNVKEITKHVDTVNFCLSKGLGSPVGSMLCGTKDTIEEAKYWRKRLGGGMRQSGILAACGIVSLTKMVDRLPEDHRRARTIAEALVGVPGLHVSPDTCPTNIVMVDTNAPAANWVSAIKEDGILALPMGPRRVRLVLHHQVDDTGVERAKASFLRVSKSI